MMVTATQVLTYIGAGTLLNIIVIVIGFVYNRGRMDAKTKSEFEKIETKQNEISDDVTELKNKVENMGQLYERRLADRISHVDAHFLTIARFNEFYNNLDKRISCIEGLKLGEQLTEIKSDIRNLTELTKQNNKQLLDFITNNYRRS